MKAAEGTISSLLRPSRLGLDQLRAGSPSALIALWILMLAVVYNFGFYSSRAFPYIGLDSDLAKSQLAKTETGPQSPCGTRLRRVQAGFFSTHTCWFNTTNRPSWVITNLFFNHRLDMVNQGDPAWILEDKCAFAAVGVHSYSQNVVTDGDRAQELINRLQDTNVLDDCTTFIYASKGLPLDQVEAQIHKLPKTLRRMYPLPLWTSRGETLDKQFYKMKENARNSNFFIKLQVNGFESDLLEGFRDGLGSGRVVVLMWERLLDSRRHSRFLKDEVEFVAGFGYTLFLVSAELKQTKQDFTRVARPAAVIRLDGGYWDDIYNVGNAPLVLTLVAVKSNHPFRSVLEKEGMLCRQKEAGGLAKRVGEHTCECELERFAQPPMTCSLGAFVAPANMWGAAPPGLQSVPANPAPAVQPAKRKGKGH